MSLTNHQLRSFARHIGTYGDTKRMGSTMRDNVMRLGLLADGLLTPAGRDALATVPHLIDPEPPKPVEPETRECDACEGAGARYVARVCPLTLHERTVFVQCEAPGCERGRVAERVARPVIDVDPGYQPITEPVKQPAKESVHSAETLALARESHRLRVCGSSRIRLQFGKYEHRRLIRVPCTYVRWLCEADFSCSACVAVFQNEQARRAAAGITVTS